LFTIIRRKAFWQVRSVLLSVEAILRYYNIHWSVEIFHRDVKQYLSLGERKVRSLKGARRYRHLLMLAYFLLRLDTASDWLNCVFLVEVRV